MFLLKNKFRIALVADELTSVGLGGEAFCIPVTPKNFKYVLFLTRPDILFVESAWFGHKRSWRYGIASYDDHPERSNTDLMRVIDYARSLNIPTIFWNKEDGIHFNRFIESAKHFDHIFTVDENMIPHYRKQVLASVTTTALPFCVQPSLHNFSGFNFQCRRACFMGSYSSHIHDRRRANQHLLFDSAARKLGLTIYDRNSNRKSENYRFPKFEDLKVLPAVSYRDTSKIYKNFLVSLNVNTVEDSYSMYSRRLVEILGCGGIVVSTPAKSIDYHFKDFCHVVNNIEQADEIMERLRHNGPSPDDLARARAGAEAVARRHTWKIRLEQIRQIAGR